MKTYNSLAELVGKTPMVRLGRFMKEHGAKADIIAKLEFFNPLGSVKDRAALSIIEAAERAGTLKPGGAVIEATSGNTGIGLSFVAAAKGYGAIIVMPDTMSKERQMLIKSLGATLILTPGAKGMKGAIEKANELCVQIPGSFISGQFDNPANQDAHYRTTGPEIWEDCDGKVDIFVSAVGSGGTITGVGRYLKERNSRIKVVAVEPADSAVLSGNPPAPHKIQGIGAGFIPKILDTKVIDEIITVQADDAYDCSRSVARCEGVLCGISSGAALWAAAVLSKKEENKGKTIVTVLPDTGERYLSTELFADTEE